MTRMSQIPAEIFAEMTPAVRAFVEGLLSTIDAQQAQIAKMQVEIDELKSQVKRLTPQNSSVPSSTVHPHARPAPKPKPKSKRTRGGQAGHKRMVRELVAIERCQEVIPLIPENCRRCGQELDGTDPQPIRHQVWELPKIQGQRLLSSFSGKDLYECIIIPATSSPVHCHAFLVGMLFE